MMTPITKDNPYLAFLLLCVVSVFSVFSSPLAPDNDLYFHLKCGEYLIRTKEFIWHDLFTYTQKGAWDESAHSWLSNIIFYGAYALGGITVLRCLNLGLVISTLFFAYQYVFKKTRSQACALVLSFLALCLHQRIQILRPLLFAECLWAFWVYFLMDRPLPWKTKDWGLGILATVLWANLHGSVVLLPPLIFLWALGQFWRGVPPGQLIKIVILLPCFTLLNPWGTYLYEYAIKLSQLGKLTGGAEWTAAYPLQWMMGSGTEGAFKVGIDINALILLLGVPASVGLAIRKKLDPVGALLSLACCALALISSRHIIYLMYPLVFLGASYCKEWRGLVGIRSLPRWLRMGFISLILILTGIFFHFPESYYALPSIEKTVNFLEATGVKGNIFNYHTWGSYLSYRLYPNIRISADARTLLHKDFFLQLKQLEGLNARERRLAILASLPPETDGLLFSTTVEKLSEVLDPKEWVVVYENNTATIALNRRRQSHRIREIAGYYHHFNIPFDEKNGFAATAAWNANPTWFRANQESVPWGKYVVPLVKHQWAQGQKNYFESRHIPIEISILNLLSETNGKSDGGVRFLYLTAFQFGLFSIGSLGLFLFGLSPRTLGIFQRRVQWTRSSGA